MKRKHMYLIIASGLVALVVADHYLANWANNRVLARKADIMERMAADQDKIVWKNRPHEQLCAERTELGFYRYQTCFMRGGKVLSGKEGVMYDYVRPRGLFHWSRLFWPTQAYFKNKSIWSKTIALINEKGVIVKWYIQEQN